MHFSFSRDGSRLAYVQMIKRMKILRLAFDPPSGTVRGEPEWVVQGSTPATNPDVSPDGRALVMDSQSASAEDISVLDLTTGTTRRVTNDAFKDRLPVWSPDGAQIAFFSNRTGKSELWMARPDGSEMRQMTHAVGAGINTPIWAPDGRRIAYHQGGHTFIWSTDRPWDSRTVEEMPPIAGFPDSWTTTSSWSPDGHFLAGWVQHASDTVGIDVYAFATRRHMRLTTYGGSPVWLADSRRILFNSDNKVMLVDSQTREVRVVATLPSLQTEKVAISADNRVIYVGVTTTEADIWLRYN
jgi:Tol biopolymer transport system component